MRARSIRCSRRSRLSWAQSWSRRRARTFTACASWTPASTAGSISSTANFVIDTALSVIFEAAQASSYEPLAGRSRKVLQEERTHALHGQAWARRLARIPETRAAFEASLRRAWDETLCWFGPEGKGDPLSEAHVLDATPDTLRERFLAKVAPDVVASELALPVRATKKGWKLTTPLPWERWDATRYRLDPAEAPVASSLAHD